MRKEIRRVDPERHCSGAHKLCLKCGSQFFRKSSSGNKLTDSYAGKAVKNYA